MPTRRKRRVFIAVIKIIYEKSLGIYIIIHLCRRSKPPDRKILLSIRIRR